MMQGKAKRSPGGDDEANQRNGGSIEEPIKEEVEQEREATPAHLSDEEVRPALYSRRTNLCLLNN